ncbi:hypothetical protein CPC08DRAFT_766848 [Agrocybe pediades]|nr:hypothetical protein CPC08DRAFT_766848 [Agrocybe pediades]
MAAPSAPIVPRSQASSLGLRYLSSAPSSIVVHKPPPPSWRLVWALQADVYVDGPLELRERLTWAEEDGTFGDTSVLDNMPYEFPVSALPTESPTILLPTSFSHGISRGD